jgi:hypothetical protein
MKRAAHCFRPFLDEFERKTLLSTGQVAHLALSSQHAVPSIAEYKIILKVINDTGRRLAAGAVKFQVDDAGMQYSGSSPELAAKPKGSWELKTPNLRSISAQLTLTLDGNPLYPTYTVTKLPLPRGFKPDEFKLV